MRNEVLRYERIRNLRIDRNLSQREVAALLNVRQNTYSQYEIGVLNYPIDVLIRLACYYTPIDSGMQREIFKNPGFLPWDRASARP